MIGDVHVLQSLATHTSDVNSVDFAGDCVLVTASGDKRIRVWQWQAGNGYTEAYFSPLMGHKYGVTSVKVSPQSTMLASASIDGTTLLWNLRNGAKIHTMVQVGGESVRVCRFSPDSTLLVTAGDNGQVCLWDLVRRNLIRCFQKHEGAIQGVCFTPDSSWLITTCTLGVLQLFSTAEIIDTVDSGPNVRTFASVDDAHDLGVVGCDFSIYQDISGNGPFTKTYQLVTCGNDHYVKLWEVTVIQDKCEAQPTTATISLCRVMEKHSSALTCVRFSANGLYIVSSGLDKTAVVWETSTSKILSVLAAHKRYVACCAFSRDGNLVATGSNDKTVVVWDLTGNFSTDTEITRFCGPKLFLSDGEKSVAHEQDVVNHAESFGNEVKLIQRLDDHGGAVNGVACFGNSMIASASGDKLVRVWDIKVSEEDDEETLKFPEKPFSPFEGHKYSVNKVEFSPCGMMLASCSLDGTTMIWNTETEGLARSSFVNSGCGIRVCRWSPDGTKLATAGDDEKTTLWDVDTMDELQVLEGHVDAITAIAFTYDSRYLVTCCNEGTWRLYDTIYEKMANALLTCDEGHDLGVQGCDFSPTSNNVPGRRNSDLVNNQQSYLLATCGNDSLVKLWQINICPDEPNISNLLEYSEITGTSNSGTNYKEMKTLAGHGGNVMDVRFSPGHGEVLGSVATDRTARLWSVFSGACLYVLEDHDSLVTSCAFSQNTSLFITGALDKSILIWKLPQQLVSQSMLIESLRYNKKKVADWKVDDTVKWLNEIGLPHLMRRAHASSITGRNLLNVSHHELMSRLQIDEDPEISETFKKQLYWLKREDSNTVDLVEDTEIPHEFLCPITHEIMREPVLCSDGFTYERAAINEWFLCGKYTSPMTNEPLHDTSYTPNVALRNAICTLLHGDSVEN